MLLDRRNEREELDRLLQRVRAGESSVLVLRGEAGIGKTALLEHVAEQASGCRIARASGVQSEMPLAFAELASAVRADDGRRGRTAGATARRAAGGVRAGAGGCAGSLPGRPGRAEPAGRGVRRRALGVPDRRRAMARRCVRAGSDLRRKAPAGGADRDGVRRPRAQRFGPAGRPPGADSSTGSRTKTHAACSRRSSAGGSTSVSATGSWRRRAATRWRSWSCRVT